MPDKVIHEIRLNQYSAVPADRTRRFSLGTKDSYGIEQLRIVPGEGWDGLTITATFHPPEGEAVQVLVPADGLIDVPPEATRSGSELPLKYGKIVFAGVADGVQRISCNLPYTVMEHAPVEGAESSGPAPSWYEQAAAHFLPGGGKAGQVLAKASDADLDVEWADGGGSGTSDHAKLSNRDAADQHPISAITGLETALDAKQPAGSYLTQESDPTVPAWAKQPQKPAYTAQEVGALPVTTAIPSTAADVNAEPSGAVAQHNVSDAAHNDIRLLIQGLTDRLNALADSDDTTLDQLSEVVAYIKSNRDLISSITTDKVSVADIVDNLTTNAANKPLSAAQGVAIKALIDAIAVPDKLPNPNALTFTGAVTGSYDGSAPLSVEIPSGGGGSGGAVGWKLIRTINLVSGTSSYSFNTDNNGNAFKIKNFLILIDMYPTAGYLEIKPNGNFSFYQKTFGKQNSPFSFMMKRATDGRYILENSNGSIFERKISNEYSSFGEFTSFSFWFSTNPASDTTMYILGEDV